MLILLYNIIFQGYGDYPGFETYDEFQDLDEWNLYNKYMTDGSGNTYYSIDYLFNQCYPKCSEEERTCNDKCKEIVINDEEQAVAKMKCFNDCYDAAYLCNDDCGAPKDLEAILLQYQLLKVEH